MKKFILFFLLSFIFYQAAAHTIVTQKKWRWRKDNGSETTATWAGAQNQAIKVTAANENIRLRVEFSFTDDKQQGQISATSVDSRLSYATNPAGPFTKISATNTGQEHFVLATSDFITNGGATTQQMLPATAPTYVAGATFDEPAPAISFTAVRDEIRATEYEWSIKPTAFAQKGTYYFRLGSGGYYFYYDTALPTLEYEPATVPSAPTGLTATAGNAKVDLSWPANNLVDNVTGYNVYRGTSATAVTTKLNTTLLTSTTFTDNTATNGFTYYYAVTAVNATGESTKSATGSATPQAPVAPVFTSVPIIAATENVPYSYAVEATDANGDAITYSPETLPAWLTLSQGKLTGTPQHADVGNHKVTLKASDGNLTTEQQFTITVSDITAPVAVTFRPANQATAVALDVHLSLTFSEEIKKGTGTITVKKTSDNSVVEQIAVTSPQVTIHNNELIINPAENLAAFTSFYVVITETAVTDNSGNKFAGIADKNAWQFKTVDVPVAPVFTSTPVTEVIENEPYSYTLSATDANGEAITYAAENLPAWLTLSQGKLTGMPKHSDVGDYAITLKVSDGNLTTEQKFTLTVSDITAPMVIILSTQPSPAKEAFAVTFIFSEEVKDFAPAHITAVKATVSELRTTDNITFTALVTPTENGEVSLQIEAGALTDVNNNANTASNLFHLMFDPIAPTVFISSPASSVLNKAFTATFSFSEEVVGFIPEDVSLGNATMANFTKVDNLKYTATIIPINNGIVSVGLAAAKVQDPAGNDNLAASELTRFFDSVKPTVALTTAAPDPTNAPFTVNLRFSEEVTGLAPEDITVTNGGVSAFTAVSGTEYTALITPTAPGMVQVSVAANVAEDVATNTNDASALLTRLFDSVAPAGYTVAFNEEKIGFENQTNVTVKVAGAEVGTTYFYSIAAVTGAPLTGTGQTTNAFFEITGLDLAGLADGIITLTFYQQDLAGNKGHEVTTQVEKLTRNIIAIAQPGSVQVPIRTTFLQVPLPATVEVTYSDNTKQLLAVTWQPGNYNAYTAAQYEITGALTLAPGTNNQRNLQARITVEVQPNKAPASLALSTTTFNPGLTANEAIGRFSAVDPDDNEFTYGLAAGAGDTHNNLFEIRNDQLFLKSNQGLSGQTQFTIRVRTTDTYRNSFEQSFSLTKSAYAKAVDQLKIVNAFTPNGDGVNDEWTVPELKFYNKVRLEVFDRSGVRLFQTTNPEKGWNGQNLNGKVLPGAFLYIIQVDDIKLIKKGVITVLKK